MLTLFKETQPTEAAPEILCWARAEWRRALDKGQVLSTEELTQLWEKSFPDHPCTRLQQWCEGLSFGWLLACSGEIREVFAHGPELVEAVGNTRTSIECPLDPSDWELWVETLAALLRADFNFTHPCCSTYWRSDDAEWRVTLLHASVSPQGRAKVFCRKLSSQALRLEQFGLPTEEVHHLTELARAQSNILIAGATGSGKTTLLSSLLCSAAPEEHVVVLEDTQEISTTHPRLTRLLASTRAGRSLSEYLAHSLRLSPDRLIVGEMRSHEVVPYLLAMNTGHRGLMSTVHASGAVDALLRVAQLFVLASGQRDMSYQEVLKLVCRNVGVVVFLEKRRVKEIIRVYGSDADMPLYDVVYRP